MTDVPASIRIEVPEDRFHDAYTTDGKREWVKRRQRLGRGLLRQIEELENIYSEEEAFETACPLLAQVFTDWNLSGDDGPLPKPWGEPGAFKALMDSDVRVMLWIVELVHAPMSVLIGTDPN